MKLLLLINFHCSSVINGHTSQTSHVLSAQLISAEPRKCCESLHSLQWWRKGLGWSEVESVAKGERLNGVELVGIRKRAEGKDKTATQRGRETGEKGQQQIDCLIKYRGM